MFRHPGFHHLPSLPHPPPAASIEATKAAEKAEQISKAFSQFDSNRDGVISYDELVGGLEKQFGFQGKPEGVMIEAAVKKLFQDLDKDGNDVIDESEFKLSLREMSARIESYIREEKDKERIRKLEAREAEEKARKAEAKLAFLNEKDPTNTDKVLSVLPYLFPLLDGLQYGRFLLQGTDNIVVQSVAVLYVLYRSIPFSGFVAFFAIQFLSANTKLNRLIRFNLNQAIFVDIALIFPGLIGGIGKAALPGLGVELPAGLGETLTDGVFFALLATLAYCAISSLLGEEPNKLPLISKTVNDRMPTIDMFNDEGFFIGRPRKGNRGDGDGDGDGKGGGDDAKNDKS